MLALTSAKFSTAQAQAVAPADLIGSWALQDSTGLGFIFRADSTMYYAGRNQQGKIAVTGRWRLDHDTLVVNHTIAKVNGRLTATPFAQRVIAIRNKQLTITRVDNGGSLVYERADSLTFVSNATPVATTNWTTDQPLTGRALPCEQGRIKIFDCQNVELLAYLPPSAMGEVGQYDLWGWTDSATGREFAIVGGGGGTSFVEVTDPVNPKYLGKLWFHDDAHGLAGVKVYKNHAFIVVEGSSAGLQVFDLTQLRDVKNAPVEFKETAHYDGFGNAHTITMNVETGFAYPTGLGGSGETCNSALYMIDVRTPTKPAFAGCYSDPGYIHDAMCVIYRGPDKQYQGREICLASGIPLGAVDIVDVTDKQHPKRISKAGVPNAQIVHQGWFTEDQRYFFLDDEGDPAAGGKTRTIVFDMADLDDPVLLTEFFNPMSDATAHNLYIRGQYMYQSNYTAGLRIVDISDPKNPKEVGHLDTDPEQSGPGQRLGTWGNYPYFKNNVVAVASNGLFLVRLRLP